MTKVVVSGIQPTGDLHLGNYLGAITRWVQMQEEGECFFFLADLHAITVRNDPRVLAGNVRAMAAALIASGVDPNHATLFPQSRVPAHPELGWLLNGTARMGWLNRMTQFKEKAGKDREGSSVGLFAYPVLQAADILLYRPEQVPVGDDQRQHVELTRDLALRFNRRYGPVFTVPEVATPPVGARVMDLLGPTRKMSKSVDLGSSGGSVCLLDPPDVVRRKIARAVTDSDTGPDACRRARQSASITPRRTSARAGSSSRHAS